MISTDAKAQSKQLATDNMKVEIAQTFIRLYWEMEEIVIHSTIQRLTNGNQTYCYFIDEYGSCLPWQL